MSLNQLSICKCSLKMSSLSAYRRTRTGKYFSV